MPNAAKSFEKACAETHHCAGRFTPVMATKSEQPHVRSRCVTDRDADLGESRFRSPLLDRVLSRYRGRTGDQPSSYTCVANIVRPYAV